MRGLVDLKGAGNLDDFSRLAGFDLRQFFAMVFQQVGQFQQHVATDGGSGLGPQLETTVGASDRGVDIRQVCVGHVGDHLAGGGVGHAQACIGVAAHTGAVDKQPMTATQKGFDVRQQRDIAHGRFLAVHKRNPEVNQRAGTRLDCACQVLCLCLPCL